MSEIKDRSIHQTAVQLVDDLRRTSNYSSLYTDVQKVVSTTCVKKDDFKSTLITALRSTGLETDLRNSVYHWMRLNDNCNYHKLKGDEKFTDWNTHLDKVQIHWEKRIHKSIHSMGTDLKVNLAKMRAQQERDELLEKWTELSTLDLNLTNYKPVYAPKDFLEVLLTIYVPNDRKDELIFASSDAIGWQFTHIPLKVKTLCQMRVLYAELARGEPILGVNPYMTSSNNFPTLEAERTTQGEKVIVENHAPIAQEFLKKGSPRCLRSKLWAQVLGSHIKTNNRTHFESLKKLVLQYDLMVDKIIIKDIQLTASNDDQYFVFEDVLYQVLLCFSRDSEILFLLKDKPGPPLKVQLKGRVPGEDDGVNTVLFPPSGVIPFHGFSMYATPFCYLYGDPVALYYTFRAFYLRYFYRLHGLNGHLQGIVSLCLLYERLLQTHEPQLWCHIKQCEIQPVRLVFKWLMRAFSGHLPPEQLLYLWDQILAYDSLEIIALLAVCIITFRKDALMQVDSLVNMENVLSDLSTIVVMPLLQMALLNE